MPPKVKCHGVQFGARDLGFSFLGSGGEPTEVVRLDQRFEEQKLKDESGTVRRGRRNRAN